MPTTATGGLPSALLQPAAGAAALPSGDGALFQSLLGAAVEAEPPAAAAPAPAVVAAPSEVPAGALPVQELPLDVLMASDAGPDPSLSADGPDPALLDAPDPLGLEPPPAADAGADAAPQDPAEAAPRSPSEPVAQAADPIGSRGDDAARGGEQRSTTADAEAAPLLRSAGAAAVLGSVGDGLRDAEGGESPDAQQPTPDPAQAGLAAATMLSGKGPASRSGEAPLSNPNEPSWAVANGAVDGAELPEPGVEPTPPKASTSPSLPVEALSAALTPQLHRPRPRSLIGADPARTDVAAVGAPMTADAVEPTESVELPQALRTFEHNDAEPLPGSVRLNGVRAARVAVDLGDGQVVRGQVDVADGEVDVRLHASDDAALEARRRSGELKEALDQKGLKLGRFTVEAEEQDRRERRQRRQRSWDTTDEAPGGFFNRRA